MDSKWQERYYAQQAGTGMVPYSGIRYQRGRGFTPYVGKRYQRGRGFFGRLWKGIALPLLKYVGRNGLESAGNVIKGFSENPDKIKEIVGGELKRVASKAVIDGSERVTKFIQTGKGTVAITHKVPKINKRPLRVAKKHTSVKTSKSKRLSFLHQ